MSSDDRSQSPLPAASDPGTAAGAKHTDLSEIDRLKVALEQKEAEAKDYYDRFVRAVADLENFKKRTQRERAEALRFAQEPLIRDLLPVVDNLERAVAHAHRGGDGQPLIEGVNLVLRNLLDLLERHKVARIDARGERFDPNRHEAVARVESLDNEPNRVVDQYQPGYLLHDRLLRPAQVAVSVHPAKPSDPVADDENDG